MPSLSTINYLVIGNGYAGEIPSVAQWAMQRSCLVKQQPADYATGIRLRNRNPVIYVTGPEKTGLIYTKYTYSKYGTYLFFCVCYPISVSCIEFLRILCIYDEVCVKMVCCQVEILHLKDWNLSQILRVDKTCFLRPSHICNRPEVTHPCGTYTSIIRIATQFTC